MSFQQYLAAKITVDDRALNADVWRQMAETVGQTRPFDIIEVGAGIGTMAERLYAAGLLTGTSYTGIDQNPDSIQTAAERLAPLRKDVTIELHTADMFDFIKQQRGRRRWDMVMAHAILDLMDVPAALPALFSAVRPGGWFYFTINFDGATILQPTIDPALDALIEQLYHQTMNERIVNGRLSGDSQCGRHLFGHLTAAGGDILAAGSSDWVVFAQADGYPADEADFLRFIIRTMQRALADHPRLDPQRFAAWIDTRLRQIERHELVYIAHQLDYFGRVPGNTV